MGKKSGGSKDASKAADKQAGADRAIATEATYADRPDQYNVWGNLTWKQKRVIDPATGKPVTKWTQKETLSPEMQALFDAQMGDRLNVSGAKSGILNRAISEMSGGPDWAQFGDAQGLEFSPDEMRQRAEDMAYQRDVMRLDPQFSQAEAKLKQQLANQGLTPGDRAYDAAMSNFLNSKSDAYERARLGAAAAGRDEVEGMWGRQVGATEMANALRDKNIQEYIAKRGFSLDEANRLGQGYDYSAAVTDAAASAG